VTTLVSAVVAGVLSYIGIGIFKGWGLRRNWVDIPNERSSHSAPTPLGGGLVIAAICLSAYAFVSTFAGSPFLWGYFLGAFAVAAVSWIDDIYSISIVWRLVIHLSAAIFATLTLGPLDLVGLPGNFVISFGPAGVAVTVIWIVWMINAYNFMDGIDGIAAVQAISASIGWLVIGLSLSSPAMTAYSAVLLGSCLGFLIHNWAPARIFLGDAGSAFLGFTFAVMPLMVRLESPTSVEVLPVAAVLLLWPFVFDSILTLMIRLVRGKRIWVAHREHLYQRLVISGLDHRTVSAIYGVTALASASVAVYFVVDRGQATLAAVIGLLSLSAVAAVFVRTRSRMPGNSNA
jgi:Fuc2NAc and GlcNAc transferase